MEMKSQEGVMNCAIDAEPEMYRLHVVTWNVGTAEPPDTLSSLLYLNSHVTTDLFVIGLQEVNSRPVRFLMDLLFEDSWSHLLMSTLGPLGYIKVSSVRLQGLLLLLFAKQAHLPFIRELKTTYTRTGIFGYWGNKGAVAVRFSFYGHMVCFLNCHLIAHAGYALQRVDEFEYILDMQEFDMNNTPHVLDHRLVFWFGDLNFRIEDHGLHFVRTAVTSSRFHLLWDKDQLLMMKKKEAFLQEFEEGPLNFQPTYKFDRAPKSWLVFNGKKRKPAWTDRILWRVRPEPKVKDGLEDKMKKPIQENFLFKVQLDKYTSDMSYGVSDHKPVIGTFCLELNKRHNTPLVRVNPEGDWSATHDPLLSYSILEAFPFSTWDWIGLYKVGFKSAYDYITYTWVKSDTVSGSDEVMQVCMSKDNIPVLKTECVLCYYSNNTRTIVGISSPFQVRETLTVMDDGLAPLIANGLDKNADN